MLFRRLRVIFATPGSPGSHHPRIAREPLRQGYLSRQSRADLTSLVMPPAAARIGPRLVRPAGEGPSARPGGVAVWTR
jgi:hypothetical protein